MIRVILLGLIALGLVSCGSDKKKKSVAVDIPGVPNEELPPPPPPVKPGLTFVSFDAFESENLTDNTGISSDKQVNSRYITLCNNFNDGSLTNTMKLGVQKALNSITRNVQIEAGVWVGEAKCTLRIDCRDFNLCGERWRYIEGRDNLKFESFTDRGLLLKQLTLTRRPWIHASNLLEIVLRDEAYYALLEIPKTEAEFLNNYLGCNLQKDFDEFNKDLFVAGVRRSRIALQKNRNVLFSKCRDGAVSITYDVIQEGITSAGRNLSINPFALEAKTDNTFQHDASEVIFTLPNRMLGMALFDGKGLRQNFAPTNVVIDTANTDLGGEIQNSRSCFECHSEGYLKVVDFVADHIKGNPAFTAEEIQKGLAYNGRNAGLDAAMGVANARYAKALLEFGLDASLKDPINEVTKQIRKEMVLKQIASMLFLSEQEFQTLLPQSQVGLLAIGQLLNGGAINFQDLQQVAQVLVNDLNLFREALGQ